MSTNSNGRGFTSRRRFLGMGAAAALVSPIYAQQGGKWICPPCGCAMDGKTFDAPGRCPACGMTLIQQSAQQLIEPQSGQFEVAENRSDPKSRRITLKYLRLPSSATTPRDPIVLLGGGPGSPTIPLARGNYRPLLDALRTVADVILLDQRGTGQSNAIPAIVPATPVQVAFTREGLVGWYRSELPRCWKIWTDQGVAINSYTTRENAADIEDLRKHLGATKIALFGISYGTHLAQAVIKYHPQSVSRVALAALEGLDQTVKRPSRVDAMLQRADNLIAADTSARAVYPDLLALMRRVHTRLDKEPVKTMLSAGRGGSTSETFVSGFALQLAASNFLRSASTLTNLPAFYTLIDKGDYSPLPLVFPMGASYPPITGMAEAMDIASGISAARLERVTEEAKTAALGDAMNFLPLAMRNVIPGLDLGDDFRAPIRSDIPALLMAGDIDGRTPLEEQRETGAQFTRANWIVVENAGHDVVLATPDLKQRMFAFFRGEELPPNETLRNAPPRFRVI